MINETVANFINAYGSTILYAVIVAIFGVLGKYAKKLYTKYINDKTKEAVVKVCVQAIEQMYKDLHGEEKFEKVKESVIEMLNQKGIAITSLELDMLIEGAVGEFNGNFKGGIKTELLDAITTPISEGEGVLVSGVTVNSADLTDEENVDIIPESEANNAVGG